MEMVVVVRDGLDIVWDLLLKILVDFARVDRDVVFANSINSCNVHPGLH